jgi:hypothetical protein
MGLILLPSLLQAKALPALKNPSLKKLQKENNKAGRSHKR